MADEFIYFFVSVLTLWSLALYSLLLVVTNFNLSFSVLGSSRRPRAPPPAFRKRKAFFSLESVPVVTAARPTGSSASIHSSTAARSTRSSATPSAASVSASSPLADISTTKLMASHLHHLVGEEEESSPSGGNLVPCKRRLVDVGDGVAEVVDSVGSDFVICEMATIVSRYDIELPSEILPSPETAKGVYLLEAMMEAKGPSARVFDILRQDGPFASQPVEGTPSLTDRKEKCVAEDGYEIGSDVDADEVRMMEDAT